MTEATAILAKAAKILHTLKSDDLEYELEEEDVTALSSLHFSGCQLCERKLCFESLEVRNQILAEREYSDFCTDQENSFDQIFIKAYEFWVLEIGKKDQVSGRFLAQFQETYDVFDLGCKWLSSHDVFEVLHLLESVLPHLTSIKLENLTAFFRSQYPKTERDLARGHFVSALSEALIRMPDLQEEMFSFCREKFDKEISPLYSISARSLFEWDEEDVLTQIIEDSSSDNNHLASHAAWLLGSLALKEGATDRSISRIESCLCDLTSSECKDVRDSAIQGLGQVVHRSSIARAELSKIIDKADQSAIFAAMNAISSKKGQSAEIPYADWLYKAAQYLDPDLAGSVEKFDFLLYEILDEHEDLFVRCLGAWVSNAYITNQGGLRDHLQSSVRKLIIEKQNLTEEILVDWLQSDERGDLNAARDLLGQMYLEKVLPGLAVDKILKIDVKDFPHFLRRLLFVTYHENQLMALLESLVAEAVLKRFGTDILFEVLAKQAGIDYPQPTLDFLRKVSASAESTEIVLLCDRVSQSIRKYLDDLEGLQYLAEMKPPEKLLIEYNSGSVKQMEAAQKKADENSIFRQIATVIPLKAGNQMFSYHQGEYQPPTKLGSVSVRTTLPRRCVLDAVGDEFRRFHFSVSTKGS